MGVPEHSHVTPPWRYGRFMSAATDPFAHHQEELDAVLAFERRHADPAVHADRDEVSLLLHPDFEEVGRLAVDRILHLMRGGEADPLPRVSPSLVVRQSTAPPSRTT